MPTPTPAPITRFDAQLPAVGAATTAWSSNGQYPNGGEDRWVATLQGPTLRIAAIDGITATERTARPVGGSGAAWAADVTSAALQVPDRPLVAAIVAAHQALHDPTVARSRDRWMTAVAAADLTPSDGQLTGELVNVGDTEVWAHLAGTGWQLLLAPRGLNPPGRQRFDDGVAAARALPGPFDWQAWFGEEDRLVGRPAAWTCPPLGRFAPLPPVDRLPLPEGCDEVVVATDGARLDPERVADLDRWLAGGLRAAERADERLWHGDVAVVRASIR
jgi:hypothetical protein